MLKGSVQFQVSETEGLSGRPQSASAMAELFAPLDVLLAAGGDTRLAINPATGLNEYGCQPSPCPDTLSFSSSTATSISARAYDRAEGARETLMRSAIEVGIEAAFDARVEAMRDELKVHLGLAPDLADVVFSPSGTDSQLQALFLARALLGPDLVTVVVAADQTGSGTVNTARGCHFSTATANGRRVQKGEPIAGLASALTSVTIPLLDEAGQARSPAANDSIVFDAVERVVAGGSKVLLQVMDSSKFGWRAPSDECLEAITARWPDDVQIVVDACQMRLGRARLRKYLARGYIVIVTGSKFFTGPPFSGALLVPGEFASALNAAGAVPVRPSRICQLQRLAAELAVAARALPGTDEFRPMAALGSGHRGNRRLLPRAGFLSQRRAQDLWRSSRTPDRRIALARSLALATTTAGCRR